MSLKEIVPWVVDTSRTLLPRILLYADLKEHIGVDCSEYQYQEEYQRGVYTWYAVEDEACCLSLFFGDNGKLMAAGAYNLSL